MIVIDASALVEVLLGTPRVSKLAARLAAPGETTHAPHMIGLEVASALRALVNRRMVPQAVGDRMIDDLLVFDLVSHAHDSLLPRIWQLRGSFSVYDAAYVALAEALGAPLLTFDANLAAAPGNLARIELFR